MSKLLKAILHPSLIKEWFFYKKMHGKSGEKIPDEKYLEILFRHKNGFDLNLKKPTLFSEKMQWLKLFDRKSLYTDLSDKLLVKEIVENNFDSKYIVPNLGVWNNADEIDFNKLPNQFVLKCNHDSGSVIVCRDKSKINIKKIRKKINKYLANNYYYQSRE